MTVKELMELLEKYPNNLRVVVNGYEDGYDDISPERILTRKIQLDAIAHDWEGKHGDPPYQHEATTIHGHRNHCTISISVPRFSVAAETQTETTEQAIKQLEQVEVLCKDWTMFGDSRF